MTKILFICHGNICRSPMAEFVMKELVRKQGMADQFVIASAATSREEIGNDIHYGTRKKLTEKKIPFSSRRAVQLTKQDYQTYDHLIAMDRYNLSNIRRIIGNDHQHKVASLLEFAGLNRDIADPWYTGDFEQTYQDVLLGCQVLLREVTQKN
ncbi:Low molecular weight protein-tyrosine-phosphatase yfkJ [uncultured Ruminococcus sp.]|uniref:protein-tyrosine-phosphatase n=1 Tax=Massiliimalia timonensis TaxID=1987501 RepID=A0A8J6PCT5_9FIRM|nr:low molecular weight protein-tyrosine-phosphatase [Massiliimalia timonensis]MBC8612037.1 low molecular weight phosphotyrosine protein phosphatase [Massiliimalia timonensis]SCH08825.1 Low molecular weight protein-tyrosine-phosphatase yfkJ [uncultured Clostridium sp.]SCI04955.1 Low molecular weight protein-tyrosine-phosphatase yfkJ [uncultured Ruminococcus sp.]